MGYLHVCALLYKSLLKTSITTIKFIIIFSADYNLPYEYIGSK